MQSSQAPPFVSGWIGHSLAFVMVASELSVKLPAVPVADAMLSPFRVTRGCCVRRGRLVQLPCVRRSVAEISVAARLLALVARVSSFAQPSDPG